ncbi:protein-disulfide isomerase [Acidimicrobiaceae bacterium USS-CC1]|uniref:Protein-disulfide isomerase n=1 Tax=Acidiferrimicrobium australe TaxID=2664430 RepID=A0ABW9QVM0_9ACTN|nr:protein-disulfide isomerase [Acidiferrimicrobium australe]
MSTSFAITWDYRCPFARNVHDHLVTALEAGGPWDVQFLAFSLDQPHVEEGEPSVFDQPDRYPGLLANEVGIVVRDRLADRFLAVHKALFDARHRDGADLRRRDVLAPLLEAAGVPAADVFAEIDAGWPLETFRKEHLGAVERHDVFGVPTFIVGEHATFVRLMDRADGGADKAVATITRIVDLLTGWPELNEFKQTRVAN